MPIRLITDSTCDIPWGAKTEDFVTILPMRTFFGDEEFPPEDGDKFFTRLKESKVLPHTSQVTPYTFGEEYKKALAAGEEVIVLPISSGLSGTYNAAVSAAKECGENKISVVDSKHATFAHRLLVEYAVEEIKAGKSRAEVVSGLETLREKVRFYAAVEDLTYLRKGGRINALEFTVANLLLIKPVVSMEKGQLKPRAKKIGIRKAASEIIAMMGKDDIDFSRPFYVGYSATPEKADMLLKPIKEKYGKDPAAVVGVGPAVGTYTGPDCCGVAFFVK